MDKTKHKIILRVTRTRKGIKEFEDEVNDMMSKGWEPHGIEIHRGLRFLCMAMMGMPPAKCDCTCPCCIEMHQGSCECECDCCKAHAHRDGRYPVNAEEDD